LRKMEHTIVALELKLQSRRELAEELKQKVRDKEEQVLAQRKKMGEHTYPGASKRKGKYQRMGAALASTENSAKLNSAFERLKRRNMIADQQFNEVKANNAKLKYQINNMRREKIIYERAFAELEKDIASQREEVEKNTQLMETDFKTKEHAEEAILNTKKDFVKRQAELKVQMEELEEKAKLNVEKSLDDQITDAIGMRMKRKRNKDGPLAERLRSKLKSAVFDKLHNEEDKRKMKNFGYYTKMWNNIRQQTGIEDIGKLVDVFVGLEQQKMTRVKEANKLVNQIRALKAQEKEMKEEREAFIRENEERMARRKAYIRALEKDIGRCEKAIFDMNIKAQTHINIIDSLIQPLHDLHQRLTARELTAKLEKFLPTPSYFANVNIDEAKATAKKKRKDQEKATPQQALHWMGFIEQRTTEIVQFYQAHLNSQKGKHPRTPSRKSTQDDLNFQRGPSAPSGKLREHLDASIHKIINITSNRPKNRDEESMPSNNNEKPLSYAELKAQALHELKGIK